MWQFCVYLVDLTEAEIGFEVHDFDSLLLTDLVKREDDSFGE